MRGLLEGEATCRWSIGRWRSARVSPLFCEIIPAPHFSQKTREMGHPASLYVVNSPAGLEAAGS